MSKKLLRKKLIFIRKKNFKKFENIETKIFDIIKNIKFKIKTIGGYYPINYELDCLPALQKLLEKNFLISLPVVGDSNQMNFFNWSFKDPMMINQ
ncbi:MAG: 5-formyltetrahydrofolate cyclo-ligase, partial [Candidatus Pelagibacter ubique]